MDLNELADRVEALAGPAREVDVAIFKMVVAPVPFQFANKIVALSYDESERCYFAPLGDTRVRYEPLAYTASIDAAMTLTAGHWLSLMTGNGAIAKIGRDGHWDYCASGEARSAPLAITAAALRTKALGAVHTLEGGL